MNEIDFIVTKLIVKRVHYYVSAPDAEQAAARLLDGKSGPFTSFGISTDVSITDVTEVGEGG